MLRNLIKNILINENIQLADKVYFKTGKLEQSDKDFILSITNGDNYTKIITDLYFILEKYNYPEELKEKLEKTYQQLKDYNKNVFPIENFDILNNVNPVKLSDSLKTRANIVKLIRRLPKIAIRNMRNDIRKERTLGELIEYLNNIDYFMNHYGYLDNRDQETKMKFIKKMFKNNTTIEDLMQFVVDKSEFLGGVKFTEEDIIELSKHEDIDIVYNKNKIMIAEVSSARGIKAIGCNSLWCFTYGEGYNNATSNWENYSHYGVVYVIIDFRKEDTSKDFMYVLTKPLLDDDELIEFDEDDDNSPLFNMANENYYDPYLILKYLFGDNYIDIIKKYLNFEN